MPTTDWGRTVFDPARFNQLFVRQLQGTAQYAVERAGHLPPVVTGTSNEGGPTSLTVDAEGVPYTIVQQRRLVVNDVVEHAFLQDLAQAHVYPGAVIQGRALLRGDIAPIPLGRQGGTITVVTDLVSEVPTRQSRDVSAATEAEGTAARRELIAAAQPRDSAGILRAEFQTARTYKEVGAKLGVNVSAAAFDVDANASLDSTFRTSTVVAVIRQTYYTATFAPPQPAARGIWSDDVDASALVQYCGAGNPPLYIDSVQYGRFICVTISGAHASTDLAAALKARWTASVSGSVAIGARAKEVLESSDVRIYTIGVPGGGQFARLGDPLADLDRVFVSGMSLNKENPGAPISFTCRHVLDNTLGHVGLSASYVQPLEAVGQDAQGDFAVWDGPGGGLVDTGIRVAPGDYLLVNAWGQIWSGVAFTGTHGPEGWPGWRAHAAAPMQGRGAANCLIGRIGGGPWFEVLSHYEATVDVNETGGQVGNLQLNINDNNPYNGDARKRWGVRVEVRRKGAAAAGIFV